MGKAKNALLGYFFTFAVSNFLGDSAGKWLTKAKWPEIKVIDLSTECSIEMKTKWVSYS